MNYSPNDISLLIKCKLPHKQNNRKEYHFMELIINSIAMLAATIKVLFAVPVLNVLFLLGTVGPLAVKALKRR